MIRTNALPGKGRVTGVASARVGAVCVYAHAVLANVLQAFGETIMHSKRVRDGIARILKRGILD